MDRSRIRVGLRSGLLAALVAASGSAAWAASVIDLGTLEGGSYSSATAINDLGLVTGIAMLDTPSTRGFLWQHGQMTDLGLLPEFSTVLNPVSNGYGYGINQLGQIVGFSDTADRDAHAMRADGGKLTDLHLELADETEFEFTRAYDINDAGQIVGVAKNTSLLGEPGRAVLFQGSTLTDLGALPGGVLSYAYGINNSGLIVGQSETKASVHAFVWDNGAMTDLGTLGGAMSYATAISENGLIVGMAQTAEGANRAVLWQNGTPLNLQVLEGGNSSEAHGVNDAGHVVGRSSINKLGASHAFLWHNGVLTDLNDLLPASSNWTLQYAAAINNYNQIVGYGLFEGETRAFLMNVPEPGTTELLGAGLLGLIVMAVWRRGAGSRSRSAWTRRGWQAPRRVSRGRARRSRLRRFTFASPVYGASLAGLLVLCALPAGTARAEAGGTPRSFLTSISSLDLTKARYDAGDPFLDQVVRRTIGVADTYNGRGPFSVVPKSNIPAENIPAGFDMHDFLSFGDYWWPDPNTPDGTPWIRRDGFSNPANTGDILPLNMMANSVQANALAYYMTGNEKYAQQASTQLRTFFLDPATKMNPNQYHAMIIPGLSEGAADVPGMRNNMRLVYDAAGILEMSPSWTAEDRAGLQDWTRGYLDFLLTSDHGAHQHHDPANHGSSFRELTALMSLYVGDDATAHRFLLNYMVELFPNQINAFGAQVLELQRANNQLYSTYHFGVMSDMAMLMKNNFTDLDLWNYVAPNGASLRQALEFMLPYWTGEETWPYNSGFNFPREDQLFYFRQMLVAAGAWDDSDLYKLAMKHQSLAYGRDPIYLTAPFGHAIPEPATSVLLAIGLVPLALLVRLRRASRIASTACSVIRPSRGQPRGRGFGLPGFQLATDATTVSRN